MFIQNEIDNIIPQLNEKQFEAANMPIDTNIRVFAGPGAGKTHTMKYRYQFLVENGINPDKILVLTFSKPMAGEMGTKIQGLVDTANLNQISTIHAFCYRELTINNPELKYFGWRVPGKYAPLKQWQLKQKIEDLVDKYWPKSEGDKKPGHKEILNQIGNSKYHGITLHNNQRWFAERLGAFYGVALANIRKDYDNWLYNYKCLEFSDMLFLMEQELINNPSFKIKMQLKYSHIIIDESQDTNYQAFKILFHILERNNTSLFLVGDVNQMMYRFQGAKPELITDEIEKYVEDIQTVILDTNYRSKDEIINSFQNLISYNYSDRDGPYDQKFFQDIHGVKGSGGSVSFSMADDIFKEGKQIADEINILVENDYSFGDMFIGARTRAQLGYIEGELIRQGVKFVNITGNSFWDGKHVGNVIGYLRLAYDTSNTEAFEKVVNIASNNYRHADWHRSKAGEYSAVRYLGEKFLQAIDYDFSKVSSVYNAGKYGWKQRAKNSKRKLSNGQIDLIQFVKKLQVDLQDIKNVGSLVQIIIDDCYEQYFKTTQGTAEDEGSNTLDNLQTVVDVASQYTDVSKFLAYVDEMIQVANDAKEKNWEEYTVLSTYHGLKGLERPIVFGMGWCEGEDKTGSPAGLLPHTFSLIDPPQFGVLPAGVKSPIQDERCVAFVCISRAMDRVYLSGCRMYRDNKMWPSRFINEMEGK